MTGQEQERHLILTFSEPVEGREEEYERWYEGQHLSDIRGVPGFTAARRFEVVPSDMSLGSPPPKAKVAVYEVEGDVESAAARLGEAMKSGEIALSPALNKREITTWVLRLDTSPGSRPE